MAEEKIAIVVLTIGGAETALTITNVLKGIDLYFSDKLKDHCNYKASEKEINYFHNSLKELTAKLFKKYNSIIYIMALGIVVRVIAPYLKNKRVDPAVVTIDESGQNVISTLSGHLGGANELTKNLAKILNANPVITTATDCQGKLAIDLLAPKYNCVIEPFSNLKLANAALVNEKKLNIFSDYKIILEEIDNIPFYPLSALSCKKIPEGFPVVISNREVKLEGDFLQLIPGNIIIGIGCRRGISVQAIKFAVDKALKKLNLKKKSIKNLATIDLKQDETGLIEYAEEKSLELDIIGRDEINKANLTISKSDFVEKAVGVPGVCEPAALLSSNNGKLILAKKKYNDVTIAVVEEDLKNEQ